jgi:S-adenosylmethionine:tRNA ribosyltransferase-isomerase
MELKGYDYHLPKEFIAQCPLNERSDSRLMVVCGSKLEHMHFHNLPDYLEKGDVIVVNESKVIQAKLVGHKSTGGRVEAILTKRIAGNYEAIVKGRVKANAILNFPGCSAKVLGKQEGVATLRFTPQVSASALQNIGQIPLPPYVKQTLADPSRYQTVYAAKNGSVAAHTAGLHFTPSLLNQIRKKGVKIARVCLHISYATFFPIRGRIEQHKMYPEFCTINKSNADIINKRKGRLFAVGTTVAKTLESFADQDGILQPGSMNSDLFIYPPYRFKTKIDALVTNFHLPKSTLLLLVCAYYGRDKIMKAYREAIRRRYRFYSFGDAMLLLKENLQPQ